MTILEKIVSHKFKEIIDIPDRFEEIPFFEKRSLYGAMQKPNRKIGLIAEIKKASPSRGVLTDHFNPLEIAKSYQALQMDAISVLTDEQFFQGHSSYLTEVKKNTNIPVLRKDFIVHEKQIRQSKEMGADAILLIAAILDGSQLAEYQQNAEEMNLDVLVEVHNEEELEKVLTYSKPKLIGVNNRNLKTFETSLETSSRLAKLIPEDILFISESGVKTKEDIDFLQGIKANGLLIGEAFMTAPNKKKLLTEWFMEGQV